MLRQVWTLLSPVAEQLQQLKCRDTRGFSEGARFITQVSDRFDEQPF